MKLCIASSFGSLLALIVLGFTVLSNTSSSLPSLARRKHQKHEDDPAFEIMEEDGLFSEVHDTVGSYVSGALKWLDTDDHRRELQYSDDCVVDGPYFYTVDVSVSPGGTTSGSCLRADQILLGHDLNLLLIRLGLGERNDGDHILSMGGVCPRPNDGGYSTGDRMLRGDFRLLAEAAPRKGDYELLLEDEHLLLDKNGKSADELQHRNLVFGFVYRGGFACGWFCRRDNRDARRKLLYHNCNDPNNWRDCYVTQVKQTLEAAIRSDIIPKYPGCVGDSSGISVTMTSSSFAQVNDLNCGNAIEDSEIKEFLESFTLSDFYISTENRVACQSCSTLDFSISGDDATTIYQSYIHADTWKESHGVQVSARAAYGGGYTPGNQPMAFDSNKDSNLQSDMRSPNENCEGGGPGQGDAGTPGGDGENCHVLGNVLIVNRYNNNEPEPNPYGGIITFTFDDPVMLSDIGIVDADGSEHRILFHFSDGTSKTFTYHGFGNNGVQRVICNQGYVVQVDVQFREAAGITEINFCKHCTDINDAARSRSTLIAMEDFEDVSPLSNWYNGRLEDGGPHFTNFLGRFAKDEADAFKTYIVPADASSLTITMDVYQIDSWDLPDELHMYVGGQHLNMGVLADKIYFSGVGAHGITYYATKLKTGYFYFGRWSDTIWRLEIIVPGGGSSIYNSGSLQIKFDPRLNMPKDNESLGIDNIKIVANKGCNLATQLYLNDFEDADAMSGWSDGRRDTSSQGAFTKFLGRYANEGLTPSKTWEVPADAESIFISYDFYKIDSWNRDHDSFRMWIDNELIDFGFLDLRFEGQQIGGSISKGVSWQAVMTAGGHLGYASSGDWFKDQQIRIDLQVPLSTGLYSDGRITLKFDCLLTSGVDNESCGFDNIRIASTDKCAEKNFEYVGNINVKDYAWHESNAISRGCTLASITSEAENAAAQEACRTRNCWIGGRHRMSFSESDLSDDTKWAQMRDPTGTLWRWSDGRPFIYSNWDTQEPDASGDSRTAVSGGIFMRHGPWWHDFPLSGEFQAVYRCPV